VPHEAPSPHHTLNALPGCLLPHTSPQGFSGRRRSSAPGHLPVGRLPRPGAQSQGGRHSCRFAGRGGIVACPPDSTLVVAAVTRGNVAECCCWPNRCGGSLFPSVAGSESLGLWSLLCQVLPSLIRPVLGLQQLI
jgi:hypothetical protein